YGSYGAIDDVGLDEARRQFDVNVFGAMPRTLLVLPHMRQQRSGTAEISARWAEGSTRRSVTGTTTPTSPSMPPATAGAWRPAVPHRRRGDRAGGARPDWGQIAADHRLNVSGVGAYADQAKGDGNTLAEANTGRTSPPTVIANAIAKAITAR